MGKLAHFKSAGIVKEFFERLRGEAFYCPSKVIFIGSEPIRTKDQGKPRRWPKSIKQAIDLFAVTTRID